MPPNHEGETKNLKRTVRTLVIIIIAGLLVIIALLAINFIKGKSFVPNTTSSAKTYGSCIGTKPATGEYIRVEVSLKGKSLRISEFEWKDVDYASNPGCFKSRNDVISMSNYLQRDLSDTAVSFFASIRSSAYNNEYEFSIKVFDDKDSLIGKFPEDSNVFKDKIVNRNRPATINKAIRFKQPLLAFYEKNNFVN